MKQKVLAKLLNFISANFLLVSILLFLLGFKLWLISVLVNCIESSSEKSEGNRRVTEFLFDKSLKNGSELNRKSSRLRNIALVSQLFQKKQLLSKENAEDWDILGNIETAQITPTASNRTDGESIWLIFNRIPRSGGITLVKLLEKAGRRNGFAHQEHEYRTPWPRFLLEQEQESLVTWFEYQHLPKSYDRHFYFVNFTKFQKYVREKPIYINIIRDPVLRIRSDFLHRRWDKNLAEMEMERRDKEVPGSGRIWYEKEFEDCVLTSDPECDFPSGTQDFTLSIPFFCGQHNSCVIVNEKWGLQMAKYTVERHYSVVGVLERMDQTFSVLQKYVPKFFSGITELYNQLDPYDKNPNRSLKNAIPLSESVRRVLEAKLHAEVELYRFVNRRLDLQLATIQAQHPNL